MTHNPRWLAVCGAAVVANVEALAARRARRARVWFAANAGPLQGFSGDALLFIVDEASGVDEAVWRSAMPMLRATRGSGL